MTARFLDNAEIKLDEAIRWYDAQALGLGDAFLVEVLAGVHRITLYPEAWHLLGDGVRRCRLTRFPYGLIYTVDKDDILVLAVGQPTQTAGLLARSAQGLV